MKTTTQMAKTETMTLAERNYLRSLCRVMAVELMAQFAKATTQAERANITSQLAELEAARP